MQITHHSLYISNPEQSLGFYLQQLGMQLVKQDQIGGRCHYLLQFPSAANHAQLELIHDPQRVFSIAKQPSRVDGYWKFSIAVGHLKTARQNLIDNGITTTPCLEIPNLAYLCHLEDPDGYSIELIQTHLIEHTQSSLIKQAPDYPLGSAAHFNLSTLRVKDIALSLSFYQELGLELVHTFRSDERNMSLYFLADKHAQAFADLQAAINSASQSIGKSMNAKIVEILWQYPETLLELQQFDGTAEDEDFSYHTSTHSGFAGLTLKGVEEQQSNSVNKLVKDPDGFLLRID
ncbi:VOC family protein [Shewanella sp. KT0246]|uniref:VOC family protein n=1 Tax=Shewanella sp. KT0246 TaxID=2815912 RepID=UPI001BBDD927|nr:VOC family protein [Shewanella sp. KT0246]GIU49530.1 hypothetical protein TUM4249_07480 [Shewanella sp. KT0246]